MELKDPGVYLFMAMCNPGVDAHDVEKEILTVIEDIKNGKITQDELDKIKVNTKADFIFSLESSSSVANLYGSYLIRGDINPLFEYEQNIENLKLQDIVDVAKKYLNKENSTTVILKPKG
jgi:zinc protease